MVEEDQARLAWSKMRPKDHREELRLKTAERVQSLRQEAKQWRADAPLEPGDLVLAEQTAHLPVEWLVVARKDDGHLVVAPVDSMPVRGAGDVEVLRAGTEDPLQVRCHAAVRLPPGVLLAELRSGQIDQEGLVSARSSVHYVLKDRSSADLMPSLTDHHPDYVEWFEDVVVPARSRLCSCEVPGSKGLKGIAQVDLAAILRQTLGIDQAKTNKPKKRSSG